jgi:RimJ/RimL family protein N-acetyltransferase
MVDIRLPVITFRVLTFRKANLSDAADLYEWVNEPEVRANSFSTQVISWENHVKWLEQRLDNSDVIILLFFDENVPIGQVRFEKKMNTFLIDYSVVKNKRGKGFGVKMLKSAIQYLWKIKSENLPLLILGEVKFKNLPSIKVFRKLGFKEQFISEAEFSFYRFSFLLKK